MFTLTCSDSHVILSNAIYTGWGKIVPVKTDWFFSTFIWTFYSLYVVHSYVGMGVFSFKNVGGGGRDLNYLILKLELIVSNVII